MDEQMSAARAHTPLALEPTPRGLTAGSSELIKITGRQKPLYPYNPLKNNGKAKSEKCLFATCLCYNPPQNPSFHEIAHAKSI